MYIKVKKKKLIFHFFNCIITNTKDKMSNNQQEQEFELTEFEATCKVCKDSFTYCSKNNIKWEEEYEICNDCEEEESPLYIGECMLCSKQNEGDWDNNVEDPVCIECEDKYEWNETEKSYSKKI